MSVFFIIIKQKNNTVNTVDTDNTKSYNTGMEFVSSKPIFNQIADYFKRLIELGVYKSNDPLPSVRDVALSEKVNPNTVQKSYQLLVDQGLVISIPKKGYFVSKSGLLDRNSLLKSKLEAILNDGFSKEEIINFLKKEESK